MSALEITGLHPSFFDLFYNADNFNILGKNIEGQTIK